MRRACQIVMAAVALAVVLLPPVMCLDDDELSEEGWLDPHDMGWKPEPPSKLMKEVLKNMPVSNENEPLRASKVDSPTKQTGLNCSHLEDELRQCKAFMARNSSNYTCSKPQEDVFLRRHVRSLLNKIQKICSAEGGERFSVQFELTKAQMQSLQTYADAKGSETIGQVETERILSAMFTELRVIRDTDESDLDPLVLGGKSSLSSVLLHNHEMMVIVAMLLFFFSVLMMIQCGMRMWKVSITILMCSAAWHWVHMYKRAVAKKHAALVKSHSAPNECFPEQLSWSHTLLNMFSNVDRCAAFHEALLVDPLWEVSPTMAFSETISQFVLLPLEHLGRNLGKFFGALLAEVSWLSSPFVLVFVFFSCCLIMIMVFGYKIRLPFFLGSLEPVTRPNSSCLASTTMPLKVEHEGTPMAIFRAERNLPLAFKNESNKTKTKNTKDKEALL